MSTAGGAGASGSSAVLLTAGWAVRHQGRVQSVAPVKKPLLLFSRCTVQMPFLLHSCIQVLVESTTFLFFISVAVFFPGLPSAALRAHSGCSHQATPRLVAHHSLDASGQSSHIFLTTRQNTELSASPLKDTHTIVYGELQDSGLPSPYLVLSPH